MSELEENIKRRGLEGTLKLLIKHYRFGVITEAEHRERVILALKIHGKEPTDLEIKKGLGGCEACGGSVSLSKYCGANVCDACGQHQGMARCYCGWSLSGVNGREELEEMGEVIDPEDY
jgi:hypothetical protein